MKKFGKLLAVVLCAAMLACSAAPLTYAANVNVDVGDLFGSGDDKKDDDKKDDDKKDDSKGDDTKGDDTKDDDKKDDTTDDDKKDDGKKDDSSKPGGSTGGKVNQGTINTGNTGNKGNSGNSGNSGSSDTKKDETKDEAKSDDTKTDETKSDETKSDDTKTDDTKKDDAKADDTQKNDDKKDETKDEPKEEIVYPTFSDVKEEDWFYGDVRTLSGMKVINGYEDGSYKPENAVTRAEFLKLIVTLLCDEMFTPDGAMFSDVPGDEWYSKYIASAIVYGFVNIKDYGDTFGPDEPITRREVAKIVNKALQIESGKYQTPYADTADSNIVALYGLCIMQGSIDPATGERLFYPDTEITRAETAAVILRIFKLVTDSDAFIKEFKETHDVPDLKLLYTPLTSSEFYNEFKNAWESSQAFLMYSYPYAPYGEEMREITEECYLGF